MIANNRSTSSTGNLTTRKKRNRWDSDEEEEDESSASHHGDVEASSSSSMRKEDALCKDEGSDRNAVSLCSEDTNRQQSQKEEEEESKIEQTSICYYSPLLHGCRYVSDCYERLDVIAEGSYGIVWKARDVLSKEIVALKQIKNIATNEGFPILALREVQALLDLSHDCIVSVHEVVIGTSLDKVFMVFPYLEMDLRDAVEQDPDSPFSQAQMKSMLHQILSAVEHTHACWYMHRDIKPSNFLVNRGQLKLCDFGLARKYHDPLLMYTQPVITLWYRPPELLFGETVYGPEVDMWSVGCVFAELLIKGVVLLQGEGELAQIHQIFTLLGSPTEETWPEFSKLPTATLFRWKSSDSSNTNGKMLRERFQVNSFSASKNQAFLDENGFDLLSRMLTLNPKKRISAEDALNHQYFLQGVTLQKKN